MVEVASNDGYLLRNFVDAGVPVLGIDPAPDQAKAANAAGVPTLEEFFGLDVAKRLRAERGAADVIIANNVMAHVPDLNGFVAGMAAFLAEDGVITVENPCISELIVRGAFDTVYHEHFCYYSSAYPSMHWSLGTVSTSTTSKYFPDLHGGTLRWHIGHKEMPTDRLEARMADERARRAGHLCSHQTFGRTVATYATVCAAH